MAKIKCKVMLSVYSYFILNFVFVYSFDIENDQYIRKRYIREEKGLCDLHKEIVSFNYNELYRKEGYTVTSDNNIFYLNICGYVPKCGGNIAVCYNKLNSTKINNIGLLSSITFAHEGIRYKFNRKSKTKINFICDRHLKEPNITHDKNSLYAFKFKSSKACYPKPTECVFIVDKYNYNISSLHRSKNNWVVQNVPNSNGYKIYLNVCGKFNSIPNLKTNSDCFYNGTQICLVYNNGSSKNLGVFSDSIQFKDNTNSLLLSIRGGSLCDDWNSIITNIEFVCSFDESGPVFVSNSICEYNIKWMTPTVCPYQVREISNCELTGPIFGSRKMKFKTENIQLNASILRYNICDRISCNGDKNVHFCLVNINNNKEETIIGRFDDDHKMISKDGLLTSTYFGDKCRSNSEVQSVVNVKLNCDYTRQRRADVVMSEDGCVANVTIHTSEACKDPEPHVPHEQCSTFVNKSGLIYNYNVSRLMLTHRNYEIRDAANPNLVYILNVCQPILFRLGTNCDHSAMVCMRDDSIADIYKRSKTLGHYESSKLTVLQNDSLLIEFVGSICLSTGNKKNDYLTSIELICNHDAQDTEPILVSSTDCEYYFKWETQYACPLINDTLQMKSKEKDTTTTTTTTTTISTITTKIKNNDSNLKMKQILPSPNPIINKIVKVTESPKILPTQFIVPIDAELVPSGLFIKNCTFQDFNMYMLPRNINITSKTGKLYSLNICNLSKTQTHMDDCKLANCLSRIKMDATKKYIEIYFDGKTKCDGEGEDGNDDGYYNSVIYMKCSETSSQPSVIKEEACGVELEWKTSAVCALLQEKPKIHPKDELNSQKSGHITTILVSVFVLLLILCVSVFISIYFWRKRQVHSSPSCLNRCDYIKVKDSAKIV